MKYAAPRGTHDVWGDGARRLQHLEAAARAVLHRYRFGELRTPIFEDAALFSRSIGEATDIVEKEMYVFADRKGRRLALRPEGTASIVRAYLEHSLAQEDAFGKYYYLGSMFRYERPQAGRYREFFQIGAEYFGNAGPAADAEIMLLATDILASVGLDDCALHVNSLGCPACRPAFREALLRHFSAQGDLCGDCQRRLERNPLRVLDCKVDGPRFAAVPAMADHLCPACADHFALVRALLDAAGRKFIVDNRLVRGLDYYTRTVFEVRSPDVGSQDALAAGGRYDDLVREMGGPSTPSVGFALGSERVLMACERRGTLSAVTPPPLALVAVTGPAMLKPAFALAAALRRTGARTIEGPFADKSLKSQMKLADRLQAATVIILGEEEQARGVALVRDMRTQEQKELAIADIMRGA